MNSSENENRSEATTHRTGDVTEGLHMEEMKESEDLKVAYLLF